MSAKVVARARFKNQRYGYITLSSPEQAQKSVLELNKTELKGRKITVEIVSKEGGREGGGERETERDWERERETERERERVSSTHLGSQYLKIFFYFIITVPHVYPEVPPPSSSLSPFSLTSSSPSLPPPLPRPAQHLWSMPSLNKRQGRSHHHPARSHRHPRPVVARRGSPRKHQEVRRKRAASAS